MNRGFTLVEVIVVLVILGVLLAVAIPSIISYIDKANTKACEAKQVNIERQALNLSALTHGADTRATLATVLRGDYPDYVGGDDLKCPSGGNYGILNGHVACDYPGHGRGYEGGLVFASKNYIYEANSDYVLGNSYSVGQIVNKNGVLFMCYKDAPNDDTDLGRKFWKIIGTADGEPVNMEELGMSSTSCYFMPGVTILDKGKTYMMVPNTAMENNGFFPKVELTEGNTLQKPPAMVMMPDALPYNSYTYTLKKGSCYYDDYGNLYRYNGENNAINPMRYTNISNGIWEPLSNCYIEGVTYKAGATVWYKGKYYTVASGETSEVPGGAGWTEQQ